MTDYRSNVFIFFGEPVIGVHDQRSFINWFIYVFKEIENNLHFVTICRDVEIADFTIAEIVV